MSGSRSRASSISLCASLTSSEVRVHCSSGPSSERSSSRVLSSSSSVLWAVWEGGSEEDGLEGAVVGLGGPRPWSFRKRAVRSSGGEVFMREGSDCEGKARGLGQGRLAEVRCWEVEEGC